MDGNGMSNSTTQAAVPLPERLRGKVATIGGDQEASFEQAFATLAFQYLSDKAPRLIDFMVGFQLVERNEDNTRAIGIFGFQLEKQWIYAPVFFLNGDLKGHELMYLKAQDQFVPLKESWVNYVLGKRPHVLGKAEPQDLQQLGILQPDLRALSVPPGLSKAASVKIPDGIADWAIPALPLLYKLARTNPYADRPEPLLPRLMSESFTVCKMAMQVRADYPDLADAMDRFYGTDAIREAVLELRKKAALAEKSAVLRDDAQYVTPPGDVTFSILDGFLPRKKTAFEKVSITVDSDDVITRHGPELDEAEQERLLRDGHLVKDHRDGDEVSIPYNTQIEVELTNPSCTSVYDVLTKPGTYERCLIVSHPYSCTRREDFCTVVRLEPRQWLNAHRAGIFVKPQTENEIDAFSDWFDKQNKASMSKSGMYVAVCKDGTGTVPFEVYEKVGDDRYRVYTETWGARRPKYLPRVAERETDPYMEDNYGEHHVVLNTNKGSKFKVAGNCIYIPEDAVIVEVRKPKKPKKNENDGCCSPAPCCSQGESATPPIEPGNIADIQLGLEQKMAQLKLYSNGGEISIDRRPLTATKQALFDLIEKYGFREKIAKIMIGQAQRARARGKAARFYVKYAQGYPMLVQQAPNAPAIPDPTMTTDQAYAPVPAHYPEVEALPVDGMSAAETDPAIYDARPEAMPDPMSMQQAQQAAQTGQKEVFDTSMINGLLKTVRQDSMVERYTGDLLKALDRLGRLYFLFLWHNDKFAERYGQSDMPELEDSIRNSFESLGDLILFIKEKDIAPIPGAEMGEPEIDEAGY
jgi:hypothetical protein